MLSDGKKMSKNKLYEMTQVINYSIIAKLDDNFLGRNVHVVQQLSTSSIVQEMTYIQQLKGVHIDLVNNLVSVNFQNVVNLYKIVKGMEETEQSQNITMSLC